MKAKQAGRVAFKTLFGRVPEMTSQELKEYQAAHQAEDYTLLDVRQPGEYEQRHLPGAKLVPLPQLSERLPELEQQKPVIAYCASGGRSRAAAEMLAGRGFSPAFSLKGGMKGWDGLEALGPAEQGLSLIKGDESLAALLALACGMEVGLRRFYQSLAPELEQAPVAELVRNLAEIEKKHEEKLRRLFAQSGPTEADKRALQAAEKAGRLEGGFDPDHLVQRFREKVLDESSILDLAMAIEAQALDLYLRMADKIEQAQAQKALFSIAEDEKAHLKALGELRDEKG